jgi:hypothetical protein
MTRGCPSLVTTFAIFPNAEMTASARPVQTKPKRNFLSHQCTPTEAEKGAQAMTVEGRSMLKRAEKPDRLHLPCVDLVWPLRRRSACGEDSLNFTAAPPNGQPGPLTRFHDLMLPNTHLSIE